jgi:hypothetical protein
MKQTLDGKLSVEAAQTLLVRIGAAGGRVDFQAEHLDLFLILVHFVCVVCGGVFMK